MGRIFLLLVIVWMESSYCEVSTPEASTSPCVDKNHMFLAPGVLSAGVVNRVCISRFYPVGPARVLLTLITEDKHTATASRELSPGDGGCLDIAVPQLPNTRAELIVSVRYPEAQCTWERSLSLRIASGRVVVVHTERARYRPGDTLRVRVFVLKPDLSPAHGIIDDMWLEGPRGAWEGSRAAQWQRVRSRLGIAQVQHELDAQAPPGRWTVRAQLADGSQGSAAFWVGNYELPPFQLSVRHAPRVLRSSERLVWTVCVRYPWTEAVEGMLVIRIRGAGTTLTDSNAGIRTAVRLRAPRACHRHAAAAKRIVLEGPNAPDVVVADFSFQEEGTRIWQNTTVVSQVVDKPVSLEFLTKHRAVVSPGLPYKLKVKATGWDDKPASSQLIRVCRAPVSELPDLTQLSPPATGACNDSLTDRNGIALVMFTADDDGSAYYRFQATLHNDTSTTAPPLYLPVQRVGRVHAALGPLKTEANAARTFVPLYLSLRNITDAITVHFVVITRGGIIYRWGATTQCPVPNSANQIHTALRNSSCSSNAKRYTRTNEDNRINNKEETEKPQTNPKDNIISLNLSSGKLEQNASDALVDRQVLRIMLPIKVTHQMCPDSHLVAYFYYNGELISATKHFEMEECFGNKVEATWQSRQTLPGSTTTLQVSTTGPALCALTALDSAAKWMQPAPSVKEALVGALKTFVFGHRNLTEYDAAGECFLMASDTSELPTDSMELMNTWLAIAGVRMLGGEAIKTRHCQRSGPSPLIADEVAVPRSDFSEAWLWRLVAVSGNGSATVSAKAPDSITRFEASATCISRNGVAISPPAVLQVFREFFIHADSPRRLRRGDSTIIRYRLFNYLYEPLSVQIQILTDPHLSGPSDRVETVCIGARASVARRVELRALLAGDARASVRAKSVKDDTCANATNYRSGVSDEIIISIKVEPEGVHVQDHKSILLCGRDSPDSSTSEVSWDWPSVQTIAVPGTESMTVWAIGNVAGPLLADADDLVLLPRGCGEQNMARLATNLLALAHLDPHSIAAVAAREHVARGFTRQLQYVHPLGGFSAFGGSDAAPSTWLTAFSVRYLREAHQVLTPGFPPPPALDRAERWLLNQQMENGCFRNEGQVFHRELRGGLNEEGEIASVALTAYVISSLLESSVLPSRILHNTLSCLRALPPAKTVPPARVYAHSLLTYTFMRLKKYEDDVKGANEASQWQAQGLRRDEEMRELTQLLAAAQRQGEFVWWETGSLSTSIEATAYALLALSYCPPHLRDTVCEQDARAAIRWLSTHRSASGGFLSTQDTLVALEALTRWVSEKPAPPTHLNVTARSYGFAKSVILQSEVTVPDVLRMGVSDQLRVSVQGEGCALIQATRSYNSLLAADARAKPLSVKVSVHTDGAFNCDVNGTSCFCAAVVESCVVWSSEFPEMALMEVSLPGGYGADPSLLYRQLQRTNTLLRRLEMSPTASRATLYLGTRDAGATLPRSGHECFQLHAVGPRAKTKPAYAKVMDYYKPSVNDTQMYTISEECPARISHESNQYLSSDNLYNKAKSLSDSEIVITNEFSFNDIPEGIPLEDPMYDNLKEESQQFHDELSDLVTDANAMSEYVVEKDKSNYVKTVMSSAYKENKTNRDSITEVSPTQKENDTDREANRSGNVKAVPCSKAVPTTKLADWVANIENIEFDREGKANRWKSKGDDAINVTTQTKYNSSANDNVTTPAEVELKQGIEDKINENNNENTKLKTAVDIKNTIEPYRNSPNIVANDRIGQYGNSENIPLPNAIRRNNSSLAPTKVDSKIIMKYSEKYSVRGPLGTVPNMSPASSSNQKTSGPGQGYPNEDLKPGNGLQNPALSNFHVIDSDIDLDVPAGIEGVPSMIVPPPLTVQYRKYSVDRRGGIPSYGIIWSRPMDGLLEKRSHFYLPPEDIYTYYPRSRRDKTFYSPSPT